MAGEQLEFQLYNSLSKQKEVFKPLVPGKVGMYVCGVTAYDFSHIGHARAYVAFDILYRYLKRLGYEVVYVRNFTDVDDKIIKRGNELGKNPITLSAEFCEEFLRDMADLQCLPPTKEPRVSEHMEQIINMISQIESNGCAYSVDGDVYFSVDSSPNYGRLSRRKLEDNRSGERVAVDSRKRNPADFALWKAAKVGEPSWDSPWGPGRPGWHIECSAMSALYLTPKFDIHGGGEDLIFPHHENEIAQSCAACPESNVSYWMHNGFVTSKDNEKMSKSLGNFFSIREVTDRYHPLALRHFLLGTHYRSAVSYSILEIERASDVIYYIYQTLEACEVALSRFWEGNTNEVADPKGKTVRINADAQERIHNLRNDISKMSDDLHTQSLLHSSLLEALKLINIYLSTFKKKSKKENLSSMHSLTELEKEIRDALDILGLLSNLGYSEVLEQLKSKALKRSGFEGDYVENLIKERALARKNKDFDRADKIRSDLSAKGISLMDEDGKTVWRPCVPEEKEEKPFVDAEKNQQSQLKAVQQEQQGTPSKHLKPCIKAADEQQAPPPTT